jgi:hypothetical protein
MLMPATVNEYVSPLVSPVTVHWVVSVSTDEGHASVIVAEVVTLSSSTEYPVISLPPSAFGFHVTTADVFSAVAIPMSGALGGDATTEKTASPFSSSPTATQEEIVEQRTALKTAPPELFSGAATEFVHVHCPPDSLPAV